MKNNYSLCIGLNIFVLLKSNSKLFSCSSNCLNSKTNTNISYNDLGFLGYLPLVNKTCIQKVISLAKSLNMEIADKIAFDRKNQFTPSLPKGYQITQHYYPIAIDGKITLNKNKEINISKIVLEENYGYEKYDEQNNLLIDLNTYGSPIVNITIDNQIDEIKDIVSLIKEIKKILTFSNLSEADLLNKSLKVELLISLKDNDENKLVSNVKIKNIVDLDQIESIVNNEYLEQCQYLKHHKKFLECIK